MHCPRISTPLAVLLAAALLAACGSAPDPEVSGPVPTDTSITGPDWDAQPREAATVFISGHSLVDQPMPDFLAAVAGDKQTPMSWNRHYIVGSSIGRRIRGQDVNASVWDGYREGYNRDSENMDVIAELKTGATVGGQPYDALVITEQHVVLEAIVNNDTVRLLRNYHDRFIDGNPQGNTYFYESWLSMDSKDDPRNWIAYERAASPIWQCVATRINVSLEAEGRSDRIVSLPAGAALAELVDRATSGSGLPGITQDSIRATVASLFIDDVHAKPLGVYYVALVSYASIYRRSPVGAWRPENVTSEQAQSLQNLAWEFVSAYYSRYRPLSLTECREQLVNEFNGVFWGYVRDSRWPDLNAVRRYARWARGYWNWRKIFSAADLRNPFFFDHDRDREYWLSAPPSQ